MVSVEMVMTPLRRAINDIGKQVNNDESVFPLILFSLIQVFNDVPELRISETLGTVDIPEQLTALNDQLPIPVSYIPALTDYAAHRYFMGDSGSARDKQRADEHLAAYARFMRPQE